MKDKILLVDDEWDLLKTYQLGLSGRFVVDVALNGEDALVSVRTRGPYAVALVDMNMPNMQGTELLERVRALSPDTVAMMLTGNADQQTAVGAVNRGRVFRFLNKPLGLPPLIAAVEEGCAVYATRIQEREILESTLLGSVNMLTDVLGMVSRDSLGRGQCLRDCMTRFARHLAAPSVWELELGALLSAIGYTAVPSGILRKIAGQKELLAEEAAIVAQVPEVGRDLLVAIPRLSEVAEIVLYQNKNFDGSGFPADRIAGEVIPLGARILILLNDRLDLEEAGMDATRALEEMLTRTGRYDPKLLGQCFKCFPGQLTASIASTRPTVSLPVTQLKPGDVTVYDVMTKRGVILVSRGSVLSAMMIARLSNFGLLYELQEPLQIQR